MRYDDNVPQKFAYRVENSHIFGASLFKEILPSLRHDGSSVYAFFVDRSQAIERIKQDVLNEKHCIQICVLVQSSS